MALGRDYHPRIGDAAREKGVALRGSSGRNLVHAADHNARVTLEALRRSSGLTRQDLSALTGLTAPGITNIIRRLEEAGLIRPLSGGRAARFGIEPEGALGLGLDIDSRCVSAAVIDLKGRIVRRSRHVALSERTEDLMAALRSAADEMVAALGAVRAERLLGIGMGTPFDAALIQDALAPLRVHVERSSIAAALGERLLGAAPADGSFVHVLFGREVRAGLMIGGSLFHGVSDRAGRIGQMRTGEDGELLDDAAAVTVLRPLIERHVAAGGDGDDFLPHLSAQERAIVDGWVERAAAHFVDAMIAISGFLAPSGFFVGGRLPRDLMRLFSSRIAAIRITRMASPLDPQWLPDVVPATLGPDCVLLGAAMLPFLETLLPDPRQPAEIRRG